MCVCLCFLFSSGQCRFARLGQWDNFQKPFEKAKRLLKSTGACLVASQACSRLLECHSLVLKKDMEHGSWRARESCRRALRVRDAEEGEGHAARALWGKLCC